LVAPEGQFLFALYRRTRLCWFWKLEKRWYAGAGEADVGQCAIIQGGEVLARAPALAPNDGGRDDEGPHAKPPGPHGRGETKGAVVGGRMGGERHWFLSLIHLFHGNIVMF
jgi:hypothetical protein